MVINMKLILKQLVIKLNNLKPILLLKNIHFDSQHDENEI